ncbi:MAG TPA: hypothetical protein VKU00_26200 [Chthonomonadaceae bacterium]|nr:hypothetical protein [Chthonomonadaceae bacterium]
MAAIPRQNANIAFPASSNAFATSTATSRRQRTPAERTVRPPATMPAARPIPHDQSARLSALILAAAIFVLCGVVYLGGQASLTNEGYRHSKLQKMLIQERALEQQWKHELAAQSTPASIEQKAKDQGMVKAVESDAITAGVPTPPNASNPASGHP